MGFGGCGVIVSGIMLIGLTGVGVGLESGFCLSVNRFLDYFIEAIKLANPLFYF